MVEYLKTQRTFLVVLVCTTVGEIVVLVALVSYWRIARQELLAPKQQHLCLPLIKFGSSFVKDRCPDGLKETHKEKNNATACCGDFSIVLDKLVTEVASNRYDSNINPEVSALNLDEYECFETKGKQPIAKLTGLTAGTAFVQVGTNFKLKWNSHSPSYALPGLRHQPDDGTIYVEQTDIYFVLSQIKMKLDFTMTEIDTTMKHYIHLISHKGNEMTLLENARPQCKFAESESQATSGIGAVFKLEKGDRLYVATSHPEHLMPDQHNNYFSIHKV